MTDRIWRIPGIRRAVAADLLDLGVLILGARGDATEVAQNRGVTAARLHSLKASIVAESGNADLTLANVAARN